MSDVTEKDLREIKAKVEEIDKSVNLLVRANRKQIIEDARGDSHHARIASSVASGLIPKVFTTLSSGPVFTTSNICP